MKYIQSRSGLLVPDTRIRTFRGPQKQGGWFSAPGLFNSSTPSTDPYFSSVTALLHMNGANGGTTFTDQIGHAFTASNATTSTAQYVANGSSGLFSVASNRVYAATNTAWDFGSGNFTIEFFVYPSTTGTTTFTTKRTTTVAYGPFSIYSVSSNLGILMSVTGTSWTLNLTGTGTPLTISAWHHVAVTRSGTTVYGFVGGVQTTTGTLSGSLVTNSADLSIGSIQDGTSWYSGYMAEYRLTKGVARYTSNFTPPSPPFPNS